MALPEPQTLRQVLAGAAGTKRMLWGAQGAIALADLAEGSAFSRRHVSGRSIVLATHAQLAAAQALVALDGVARRIIICPPDLPLAHLAAIAAEAEADAIVTDRDEAEFAGARSAATSSACDLASRSQDATAPIATEWVLLTSGTTGVPKMVVHSLAALTGAIKPSQPGDAPPVWATFYDIRRYGGLQILLRALFGNGSMVLVGRGRARCRPFASSRRARRHAYFRHAVALAPGADEFRVQRDLAALCAPLWRNRRSGHSRCSQAAISRGRCRPCLCLD